MRLLLTLCAELGLYVIAKIGPYVCAEWEFGGLPWWLESKDNIEYRVYNEVFLKYMDLYFDKIILIIARHQITCGGSVILVRVENEYWLVHDDQKYLNYMSRGICRRGIEVLLISCIGHIDGAIECSNSQ